MRVHARGAGCAPRIRDIQYVEGIIPGMMNIPRLAYKPGCGVYPGVRVVPGVRGIHSVVGYIPG